jgi:hypothetical protein
MTSRQFTKAMTIIGWSNHQLAERLGCSEKTVRLWRLGAATAPPDIADWLTAVAEAIAKLPPPQFRDRRFREPAEAETD